MTKGEGVPPRVANRVEGDTPALRSGGKSAHTYEFTDRAWEGYRGRWRYRVIERDVATLYGRTTFSVLFHRRSDATEFASKCEVFSAQVAARWMDSCGYRPGDDFKVESSLTGERLGEPQGNSGRDHD